MFDLFFSFLLADAQNFCAENEPVAVRLSSHLRPWCVPFCPSFSALHRLPGARKDGGTSVLTAKTQTQTAGGPGAGKGTMCQLLAKDFNFGHYSAGELLRTEVESGSEAGNSIKEMLRDGQIVPSHITIGLLRKSIETHQGPKTFLIDGFPRNIDQGRTFEETITPCKFVLFLDAPEEIMQERLLRRALESGRDDDNLESIMKVSTLLPSSLSFPSPRTRFRPSIFSSSKKTVADLPQNATQRFKTHRETCLPVVDHYDGLNKVVRVSASLLPLSLSFLIVWILTLSLCCSFPRSMPIAPKKKCTPTSRPPFHATSHHKTILLPHAQPDGSLENRTREKRQERKQKGADM